MKCLLIFLKLGFGNEETEFDWLIRPAAHSVANASFHKEEVLQKMK